MYGGARSLASFSPLPKFGFTTSDDQQNVIKSPFNDQQTLSADDKGLAQLQFANRFGISSYAANANNLAKALASPASQLIDVNARLGNMVERLTDLYQNYTANLRKLYLPEEVIFAKADAYIRPLMSAEMDLLKMEYPFAVGQLGGAEFTPLGGIAEGRGDASAYQARKQFSNWRSLKKAFKKQRKSRKRRKSA